MSYGVVYIDGFSHYNTSKIAEKWNIIGTPEISSGNGRHFGDALYLVAGKESVSRGVGSLLMQGFIIGFALKPTAVNIGIKNRWVFWDGSTAQVCFMFNSDGTLSIRRGDFNGTELGVSSQPLSPNVWTYIEFKCVINNTTGSFELRFNGNTVASDTGIDTQNSALARVTTFEMMADNFGFNMYIDDLYLSNLTLPGAAFLGDKAVETRLPDGDGAASQWTPSAGSNYQCVDDNPPNGDTDYVSPSAINDEDLYTFPALDTTSGDVIAVQLVREERKDDPGTPESVGRIRSNGTTYDIAVSGQSPGDSYAFMTEISMEDPDTSSDWTIAGVNAAQFGMKRKN